MDKKKALEILDQMIAEHKRDDIQSVFNEFVSEIRSRHIAPLTKAIQDVVEDLKKVDPTTKLPGTLLDKGGQHNEMGAMQGNLNPGAGADMSNGIIKADPASAAPMLGSEGKKDWKGFMAKCMTMKSSMKKDEPASPPPLGGTGTGAPSTPQSRPNKGFGAIVVKQEMKKDDKPHPAGSPEERSHAVVEGMVSLPKAASQMNAKGHESVQRFFNHMRSLKDKSKMRSPENNMTQKSEEKPENQKDMSQDAKSAIMESADKPMKVQPNRPGQANKPS